MDKQIAKKWVDVLRSGKFSQAKGQLRHQREKLDEKTREWKIHGKVGYCCLGVLCSIYEKSKGATKLTEGEWSDGGLPTRVRLWAGMKSTYGDYEGLKGSRDLTRDNDTANRRFKQIADIIEREVEVL